jgi:hypothetical protein
MQRPVVRQLELCQSAQVPVDSVIIMRRKAVRSWQGSFVRGKAPARRSAIAEKPSPDAFVRGGPVVR